MDELTIAIAKRWTHGGGSGPRPRAGVESQFLATSDQPRLTATPDRLRFFPATSDRLRLSATSMWLLTGVVLACGMSRGAHAQDMTFTPDEVRSQGTGDTGAGTSDTGPSAGTGDTGSGGGTDTGAGTGGDVIGQLATSGTGADQGAREPAAHAREVSEEIYAVQQVYALRINRVEVAPSIAFTMNDQYVSHPAAAIALNYWWTNVLAVGVNFLWYGGLESESDLNFHVRRSTRLAVPITEYQLGAHLNFTYVPLYGKFNMFNELIFQWDAYVMGGIGFLRTRPVPVIDPEIRSFDFDFRVAFNVGIGIRVFVTRWFAVFAELRDYMYLEQLENTAVGIGAERLNRDHWTADGTSFTNNVTAHLGVTIFLPFEFDYHKPR